MKWALAICLMLTLAQPLATASVLDTFGFGARGMAMGSAHTAIPSDSSANYYNPGALTLHEDVQIDLGYLRTASSLRMNGEDLHVDESHGSMIGLVVPGQIGSTRLALGLSFYMPDARISRVRALPETQPRFVTLDNRGQHVEILANLAVRPLPSLSIGGGLAFLTSTRGQVTIEGDLTTVPEEGRLHTAVDVDFETARFPMAGIHWTPRADWAFGARYRGESQVKLDLNALVNAKITGLLGNEPLDGIMDVTSFNTNFFAPQQVTVGAGWWTTPNLLFALDISWLDWSNFPTPTADVSIDFQVDPLETDALLPAPSSPKAPGFQDTYSIRSGMEYSLDVHRLVDLKLRAGYGYEPSPAPEQKGPTNYIDNDKHLVTTGVGVGLFSNPKGGKRPVQLDVTGQTLILPSRKHIKSNPADQVGDIQSQGEIWTLCVNARFLFPW